MTKSDHRDNNGERTVCSTEKTLAWKAVGAYIRKE